MSLKSRALAAALAVSTLAPGTALAWGSYGHQQVNSAALVLLKRLAPKAMREYAACVSRHRDLMVRYAITPDADWKMAPNDRLLLWTLQDIEKALAGDTDPRVERGLKKFASAELKKSSGHLAPPQLLEALAANPRDAETLVAVRAAIARSREADSPAALREGLEFEARMAASEQPLHFFEADAFVPVISAERILLLPSEADYLSVFDLFRTMLSGNAGRVAEMNPKKKLADPANPTAREVARHGTAPWRTLQLFDLAVESLRSDDLDGAFARLGILGHYVGDMAQPFHGTLDFDGEAFSEAHDRHAKGIHAIYEDEILKVKAEDEGARADRKSKLWSSLAPTERNVLSRASERMSEDGKPLPLLRDSLPREVVRLVSETYPLAEPLLDRFAGAMEESGIKEFSKHVPTKMEQMERVARRFSPMTIGNGDVEMNVLETAEERMSAAATLVARIWLAAYAEAGFPKVGECELEAFSESRAVRLYPQPNYLPAEVGGGSDEETEAASES